MRILVTGASGFVGRAVVEDLAAQGHRVRAAMRQPADIFARTVEVVAVSDLARPLEWRPLLSEIDTVVHLAGIAHTTSDLGDDLYDRVNRAATAALAAAAARNRIQRLVFVSSIRAQAGPATDHALTETDTPHPVDPYGRSKLAAEDAIRAAELPYTILRPALIYGPGVKGNLAQLIRLARSPWPLPLGALRNRRSLLARSNLVGAIHLALATPAMRNETYVVADPAALTIAEIVAALRAGLNRGPRLLPVPPALLALACKASGRAHLWDRIGGSCVVDPAKLLAVGWRLTTDTRAGLAAAAQAA